jgi:hypothetical protein
MKRAKRGGGKEEEGYMGSFCAICGKKAGECDHGRRIYYLGERGEFVVAE